jgi:hypothetical protein
LNIGIIFLAIFWGRQPYINYIFETRGTDNVWWIILLIIVGSIILLAAILLSIGDILFKNRAYTIVNGLFRSIENAQNQIITEEDIVTLPVPVQKYLRITGVIGREKITTVRLKQQGSFRQGENPWMEFNAEQYYTPDPPSFVWIADMKAFPILHVKGRDLYSEGQGNMLIKIPPFITIADARGKEITQGTLLRYLNEIMWFPAAYVNEYIQWKAIDDYRAEATMTYLGTTVSALLYFDNDGRLMNFEADRYYTEKGMYSLQKWTTPIKEYGSIKGMYLPIKGEGVWKLPSGDFPYIRLEITDIEYNNPSLY